MPVVALVFLALCFVTLFVLRTALHWWRTGETGMHLFADPVGSPAWWAGASGLLALAAAAAAPLAAIGGLAGGIAPTGFAAVHAVGLLACAAGLVGCLWAQLSMGASWRIGVAADQKTELVTHGIYAHVRNPIFSFMVVSAAGLCLLVPNALSVAALALTVVCVELQVRVVEEPYLRRVHGDSYAAYTAKVGRFVPGIGRMV